MPQIHLYVEMLVHIKQMTLYASLQNPRNEDTKVLLSSDKTTITANHEGESASLYLPTQISGTANVAFPIDLRTEITAKLQIEDLHELETMLEQSNEIEVPWGATEIEHAASISCKSCESVFVSSGKIRVWKDLPNENWADLMDLWFCHKPHDDNSSDQHAAGAKGFSATSKMSSSAGTGLVDTVSFLLHPSDCQNIGVTTDDTHARLNLLKCVTCEALVGSSKDAAADLRLYKSRLLLEQNSQIHEYPTEIFLCAQLLSLVENTINRKVVVFDQTKANNQGLLCWIFNPDIIYSSSARDASAHRAMKILYKPITDPTKILDENSNTLEELIITPADYEDLLQTLERSKVYLPPSARSFQEWQIGLLDRYEKHPSGCNAMSSNALNHGSGGEGTETLNFTEEERLLYVM